MKDQGFYLYRLFDSSGALLYVGVTINPKTRFYQHASVKDWWKDVDGKRVERFDTAKAASSAERVAIHQESPLYNVAGVSRAYIEYVDRNSPKLDLAGLITLADEQMKLATLADDVSDARAYRDHMIREARAHGHTWQAIQDATGLTPHAIALALKRKP
jgi:predicted GIY-YIG superfamily endonuclease